MRPVVPLPRRASAEALADCIAGVQRAASLRRPPVPTVALGIATLDALTGGLPRGGLTEICGPASSGRTSLLLTALARMSARQEVCALVDASDRFDPHAAAAAGVNLERLLWVRCGPAASPRQQVMANVFPVTRSPFPERAATENGKRETVLLEQALKATDLLLQGGGFGLVALDLGDIAPENARRVPLTSWFRFRRAVEHTPTILLLLEQESCAKTCASLLLKLSGGGPPASAPAPPHAAVLPGFSVEVELVRTRGEQRKPAVSAGAQFDARVVNF